MFDKLANTSFTIHDGETGNYIGKSHFVLPPDAEMAILNLINYGKVPEVIMLTNVTLSNPVAGYTQPSVSDVKKRDSILTAIARDKDSRMWIPIKIRLKFDMMARGNLSKNGYFYDSMELSNLELIDIKYERA